MTIVDIIIYYSDMCSCLSTYKVSKNFEYKNLACFFILKTIIVSQFAYHLNVSLKPCVTAVCVIWSFFAGFYFSFLWFNNLNEENIPTYQKAPVDYFCVMLLSVQLNTVSGYENITYRWSLVISLRALAENWIKNSLWALQKTEWI